MWNWTFRTWECGWFVKHNVEIETLENMEKLIRSKIAEIEKTYPIQIMENRLLQQLQQILESSNDIDENQFCRQFDSEVSHISCRRLYVTEI